MTDKQNENNKIIKVDFQKKNNKESKHVVMLLPEAAFPFNLNADTMLILGDISLAKKIWKGYYEHKLDLIDGISLQCLVGLDVQETVSKLQEPVKYKIFIPDMAKGSKQLYLSDLSPEGIKLFNLLKRQTETKNIKPWTFIYKKLIDKAINEKVNCPKLSKKINPSALDEFLQYFDPEYQIKIKNILLNSEAEISQKILEIDDLK